MRGLARSICCGSQDLRSRNFCLPTRSRKGRTPASPSPSISPRHLSPQPISPRPISPLTILPRPISPLTPTCGRITPRTTSTPQPARKRLDRIAALPLPPPSTKKTGGLRRARPPPPRIRRACLISPKIRRPCPPPLKVQRSRYPSHPMSRSELCRRISPRASRKDREILRRKTRLRMTVR